MSRPASYSSALGLMSRSRPLRKVPSSEELRRQATTCTRLAPSSRPRCKTQRAVLSNSFTDPCRAMRASEVLLQSPTLLLTCSYMPLAISALSAAAASATSTARGAPHAQQPPVRAAQVPETMDMPVPIPTPRSSSSSLGEVRSRTYQMASAPAYPQAISSARLAAHPRSISSSLPAGNAERPTTPSQQSSSDSLNSRGSTKWAEMSYEHVGLDEARDAPAVTTPQRPGSERKRSSSWFGWPGAGDTPKGKSE